MDLILSNLTTYGIMYTKRKDFLCFDARTNDNFNDYRWDFNFFATEAAIVQCRIQVVVNDASHMALG
jgi:hypothetical protein